MSTHDLDALRRQYEGWSTDDLLRVAYAPNDHRPEAVEIARQILGVRNVPIEGPVAEMVVAQLQAETVLQRELADLPLGVPLRVVCVLFSGSPGIAIAAYYDSQGYTRRASEALKWVFVGLVTWFLLDIVCFPQRGA